MSLFIRDAQVNELAQELQKIIGARTKTDAVRLALEHEIKRARAAQSFEERNAKVMAMADALGPTDPNFDMKAFCDELWGEI